MIFFVKTNGGKRSHYIFLLTTHSAVLIFRSPLGHQGSRHYEGTYRPKYVFIFDTSTSKHFNSYCLSFINCSRPRGGIGWGRRRSGSVSVSCNGASKTNYFRARRLNELAAAAGVDLDSVPQKGLSFFSPPSLIRLPGLSVCCVSTLLFSNSFLITILFKYSYHHF